jgi:4-carboxymuconolactone decarboxylase
MSEPAQAPLESERRAQRGPALMTEMFGADKVAWIAARNTFAPDWHRWTTDVLFGEVWQTNGVTRAQRSMITIAALIPTSRERELENHIRAALVNGLTIKDLAAITQHVGFYAGWPAVDEALFIIRRIQQEQTDT